MLDDFFLSTATNEVIRNGEYVKIFLQGCNLSTKEASFLSYSCELVTKMIFFLPNGRVLRYWVSSDGVQFIPIMCVVFY